MKNDYVQYFLLFVACAIAWSQTEAAGICSTQIKKCSDDTKLSINLPQKEITRILDEWKRTRKVSQEDHDRFCKYNVDLMACYDKLKTQCANDVEFKIELGTEMVSEMFGCADDKSGGKNEMEYCKTRMTECVAVAAIVGKITSSQFQRIRSADEKKKYLIAQIGRVPGCKLVAVVTECFDKSKVKCDNEPGYKSIMDATEDIRTQFRCLEPDDDVTTKCEAPLNKCKSHSMDAEMRQEIDQMVWMIPGMEFQDMIDGIGKEKACKFVKNFQNCHEKVKEHCGENDLYFKPISDIAKVANDQFTCDCVKKFKRCSSIGMAASEVTQNEIDSVLQSVANRKEQIDKIGKERGCKFVEAFNACHDTIKSECSADEPNFKPVLEITKMAQDQLKCGCASAVASLLLIFASLLAILYPKSSL